MSSILEIIELAQLSCRPSVEDEPSHRGPDSISPSCHALLEEAEALGLDLHDVITAVRRCATSQKHFN